MKNQLPQAAFLMLGFAFILLIASSWNDPATCRMFHLTVLPDDLFEPAYVIRLSELEPGREHRFSFTPKYSDLYEIGFRSIAGPIPMGYYPPTKVVATFSVGDQVVGQIQQAKPTHRIFGGSDGSVGKIGYGMIGIPVSGKPIDVRVEFPDGVGDEVDPAMEFYVAVSGMK